MYKYRMICFGFGQWLGRLCLAMTGELFNSLCVGFQTMGTQAAGGCYFL